MKNMKMTIFNFLHKVATNYRFWSQKLLSFLITKMYFDSLKISEDMRKSLGDLRGFYCFQKSMLLEKDGGLYLSMPIQQ